MQRRTPFPLLLIALFMLIALSACALPTGRVTEPLSPQEQLLLSTALKTSLHEKQSGIPEGRSVTLTASSLRIDASMKGDISQNFVKRVLAGWLGNQGIHIRDHAAGATTRETYFRMMLSIQSTSVACLESHPNVLNVSPHNAEKIAFVRQVPRWVEHQAPNPQ